MARVRIRLFHWYFLLRRPMTLGTRVAVFDERGRVLLVRHTYVPGWHFPGGGVERGETAGESLVRELAEEAGIEPLEAPLLVSTHLNRNASPRDHVLFHVCRNWRRLREFRPDREIAEAGFFDLSNLPDGTVAATRQRLAELAGEAEISPYW